MTHSEETAIHGVRAVFDNFFSRSANLQSAHRAKQDHLLAGGRFSVGQWVGLAPEHTFRGVVSGRFRIVELLKTGGDIAYRIKSPDELFERTARSEDLCPVPTV